VIEVHGSNPLLNYDCSISRNRRATRKCDRRPLRQRAVLKQHLTWRKTNRLRKNTCTVYYGECCNVFFIELYRKNLYTPSHTFFLSNNAAHSLAKSRISLESDRMGNTSTSTEPLSIPTEFHSDEVRVWRAPGNTSSQRIGKLSRA